LPKKKFGRVWHRIATVAAATLVCLGAPHNGMPLASAARGPAMASLEDPTDADRALLLAQEADLVETADGLKINRQSSTTTSGKKTDFEIRASATSGSTLLYNKVWTCERTWWKPNSCDNFASRRAEFFAAALSALRTERSARATAQFDLAKLRDKNRIDLYGGAPFFLVNNLSTQRNSTAPGQPHTCLDVDGDPGTAAGAGLLLRSCEFRRVEPKSTGVTDQVWRIVPGTGLVQNVLSGLCLDVAGSPLAQVEGSLPVLSECISAAPDQQWGFHPLGYLVNLWSGRCLDMNGASATSNGAAARVVKCDYGLSAKPNSPGSSAGLTVADAATDQSWSQLFLDGGLDPLLPFHLSVDASVVPPQTIITAAPSAKITHFDDVNIAFGSDMLRSTFKCKLDYVPTSLEEPSYGTFAPCTSPFTYDIYRGERGAYTFTVRATNQYGLTDPTDAVAEWSVVAPIQSPYQPPT
jgi:hypothetical protein